MFDKLNELIIRTQIARREEGQAMVEYGLLVGLVSVVAVAALTLIGTDVDRIFNLIKTALDAAK